MRDRPRILFVEDEQSISAPFSKALEREGFEPHVAATAARALQLQEQLEPDLILLDLHLPDGDGRDVCRTIRARSGVPIIILTARGTETDRIVGLELGADDYVVKPFSGPEVIARMRAVLRRVQPAEPATPGGADHHRRPPRRPRRPPRHPRRRRSSSSPARSSTCSPSSIRNAGKVVTREDLMDRVWDENWFGSTKTLDVHVRWLRGKLGETADNATYLQTVRGVGFRFRAPDE